MSERGDNHLPELADGIRKAHAAVIEAEHRCAEAAMEAGALLNEAKALVKHGEWTQWLAENTGFSGRTARRYMQIAASSFKTATVADLGIRRTAEILAEANGDPVCEHLCLLIEYLNDAEDCLRSANGEKILEIVEKAKEIKQTSFAIWLQAEADLGKALNDSKAQRLEARRA